METETKEAALTRKILAALVLSAAVLVLCLPSSAASQTGAIKGRVVDKQGKPVPGAYLYLTSPTMLGVTNSITSKAGRFGVTGLTPGRFKVLIEMPGFKTVTVENVAVNAGATATLDLKLEPSELEDEVIGGRPGPTLDRDSARQAVVLDSDLLSRLPLKRDFTAILGLVPGLVYEGDTPSTRFSVNGLPVTTNVFVQDGINVTHPEDERSMSRINVDLIDQVVVETAGHAAEAGPALGAYVNVIHRPGGSSFQGSLAYTNASKGLSKSLWSADEIAGMGGAVLPSLQREHDFSLTLGGPMLEDISWLFANIRYRAQSQKAPFRYWTDPLGVRHFVYDLADRDRSGLFKFSISVLDKFKGILEFGFSNINQPVFEGDVDRLRPEAATRQLAGQGDFLGRGGFSYNVNESMRVSLGVGYSNYKQPLLLNETASVKPQYYDVITGHSWGSGSMNDREAASRMRADVSITRFQDSFLGMPHELAVGGEYETVYTTSSVWKADNLIYNYAAGSPYTYGRTVSPTSGNDVGWGLIGFWIAPAQEGALSVRRELKRLGFFAQDTMRIGNRLSLSGGLRFDRSDARFPAIAKGVSGNSISSDLGSLIIGPQMGYNLYGEFSLGAWEKAIIWNTLSPRAGLSFDVLGNGMTILKGSYARIPEYLGLGYSRDLAQLDPLASHDFVWYDESGDGVVNDGRYLCPHALRLPRLQERVFQAGRRPRPQGPRHRGMDRRPGTGALPRFHALRQVHLEASSERHRTCPLRPLDASPLVAGRRRAARLVGPLLDRRPRNGRLCRRPRDPLSPLDHGARFLREDRERSRAHGEIHEPRVFLPQEDVPQLAALRVFRLEPVDRDDERGLPLERREFPGHPDAQRVHQHRPDRSPPPGPSARRPPRGDRALPLGHLSQLPLQGPERLALGQDGDHHPAGRLGRGERRRHDPGHRLPGEPGLEAFRLLEKSGLPVGKGIQEGRPESFSRPRSTFSTCSGTSTGRSTSTMAGPGPPPARAPARARAFSAEPTEPICRCGGRGPSGSTSA